MTQHDYCYTHTHRLSLSTPSRHLAQPAEGGRDRHYHGNPGVPEGEGEHHVRGESGDDGKAHPHDVPARLVHDEAQDGRGRSRDDVHNASSQEETEGVIKGGFLAPAQQTQYHNKHTHPVEHSDMCIHKQVCTINIHKDRLWGISRVTC